MLIRPIHMVAATRMNLLLNHEFVSSVKLDENAKHMIMEFLTQTAHMCYNLFCFFLTFTPPDLSEKLIISMVLCFSCRLLTIQIDSTFFLLFFVKERSKCNPLLSENF